MTMQIERSTAAMVKQFLPYIVPLLLAALIIRRSGRPRSINTTWMWVLPGIYGAMALAALVFAPYPGPLVMLAFAIALLAGGGIGYLRARHQTLSIDPETGKISSRATAIGSLLLLGLCVLRFGIKTAFPGLANHEAANAAVLGVANGLLIFTAAMFVTRTVLIWRQAKPLLEAHAAGKSNAD